MILKILFQHFFRCNRNKKFNQTIQFQTAPTPSFDAEQIVDILFKGQNTGNYIKWNLFSYCHVPFYFGVYKVNLLFFFCSYIWRFKSNHIKKLAVIIKLSTLQTKQNKTNDNKNLTQLARDFFAGGLL